MAGSRERERRRARERYERQQELRLARQRKIRQRFGIGLAVVCVLGLIGGLTVAFAGGSTPKAAKPKATASASPSASASRRTATASAAAVTEPATHCTYTTSGVAPAAKKVSLPPATPNYKAAYTAAINTNLGTIDINLLNSKATCTVNSFVHLATAGYFNASQCHRVTTGNGLYVLQCGDPYAKASMKLTCSQAADSPGTGGPGYEFDQREPAHGGIVGRNRDLQGRNRRDGEQWRVRHQWEPVLPRVQGQHPWAGLHALRDNYLWAGYPPESG